MVQRTGGKGAEQVDREFVGLGGLKRIIRAHPLHPRLSMSNFWHINRISFDLEY